MQAAEILVVDDLQASLNTVSRILTHQAGHRVTTAQSAQQALAHLETRPFDLAILDIVMPGISGIELAERIKRDWPATPVIFMTGFDTHAHSTDSVGLGSAYLVKPVMPPTLLSTVHETLNHRRLSYYALKPVFEHGTDSDARAAASCLALSDEHGPTIEKGIFTLKLLTHHLLIRPERPRGQIQNSGTTSPPPEPASVELTKTEHAIFGNLLLHAPRAMAYVPLARLFTGQEPMSIRAAAELLRPHIFSLRLKIEPDAKTPRFILTVRNVGYRVAAEMSDT
jgi:DNA-binding response OmpR family regulator